MTLQFSGVSSGMSGFPPLIRTLVLDDSAFDRARIRRLGDKLDLSMEFDEADSVKGLVEQLDRHAFDLFLIDYAMPDADGLQALELVRNHAANRDAAAIMISGNADTRVAVTAMKRGCQDFISKDDMSSDTLRSAVLAAISGAGRTARGGTAAFRNDQDIFTYLQSALTPDLLREVMHKPLEEGMRRAADAVVSRLDNNLSSELARFIQDFQQVDAFEFPWN